MWVAVCAGRDLFLKKYKKSRLTCSVTVNCCNKIQLKCAHTNETPFRKYIRSNQIYKRRNKYSL